MYNYQTALDEMLKLDEIDFIHVILTLMERDKLKFVDLAKHYVYFLEEKNKKVANQIMPLALHLAMAINDMLDKETAKKLIREAKYFNGSRFGDDLEKELGAAA